MWSRSRASSNADYVEDFEDIAISAFRNLLRREKKKKHTSNEEIRAYKTQYNRVIGSIPYKSY